MENYTLKQDVPVFCITAKSFPNGITEAFDTLSKLIPDMQGRTLYGISSPVNGVIVYKAAVTELKPGEGEQLGCEPFVIKRGEYLTETLHNVTSDSGIFRKTFEQLLATPLLDKNFPCVEWYKSMKEVMCMVRLKNNF